MTNWFEELPEKCPPDDSFAPQGQTFYRLVSNQPVKSEDFVSQAQSASLKFKNFDPCILRAVSIFLDKKDCEKIGKLPRHQHKLVHAITLAEGDGLVKQTFNPSHYSWWRSVNFEIEMNE